MKIAPRLFTGLAALALVFAGMAAVAPGTARAAPGDGTKTIIAVAIFTAVTIATFVLIDEEGDDEEEPQSP